MKQRLKEYFKQHHTIGESIMMVIIVLWLFLWCLIIPILLISMFFDATQGIAPSGMVLIIEIIILGVWWACGK